MNNNYFFNPANSMMRSVPYTNIIPHAPMTGLPRLSSLFSGAPRTAVAAGSSASKLTFSSILNGASKTLGVINQAIPVFYQAKPIWNNARTMFRVAKELNSNNTSQSNTNNTIKETKKRETQSGDAPTFFI